MRHSRVLRGSRVQRDWHSNSGAQHRVVFGSVTPRFDPQLVSSVQCVCRVSITRCVVSDECRSLSLIGLPSVRYNLPLTRLSGDRDCLSEACCVHKTPQETFSAISRIGHALVLTRARGARAPARRSRDGSPSPSGRARPGSWRQAPMRAASPPPGGRKAHGWVWEGARSRLL